MAQFYTSSPLGLLSDPLNIAYDGDGSSYKSVFSSYSGKEKQVFKASNSAGQFYQKHHIQMRYMMFLPQMSSTN